MDVRYDPATSLWASTELVVGGQDVTGVVLAPIPGITLEGRLVFEGTRAPPSIQRLSGMGLPLSSGTLPGAGPVVALSANGRFTTYGMPPGVYWPEFPVGIRTPIGAWWLKSIAIEGREALDGPLDLQTSTRNVVVTLSDTASELTGHVTSPAGEPATNAMVVVFPVDRRGWFFYSRRIAQAPVDAQGRYVVRNLPPGDYLMVVSATLEAFEWFDRDTLEKLAPSAVKVSIRGNEAVTRDISVGGR
jgi:hypothetical protein